MRNSREEIYKEGDIIISNVSLTEYKIYSMYKIRFGTKLIWHRPFMGKWGTIFYDCVEEKWFIKFSSSLLVSDETIISLSNFLQKLNQTTQEEE